MDDKRHAEVVREIERRRIEMEQDEHRLFRKSIKMGIALADIRISIVDADAQGERGGTEYMIEQRFSWKATESKEDFISRALKSYDIITSNMVTNHG